MGAGRLGLVGKVRVWGGWGGAYVGGALLSLPRIEPTISARIWA